MIARQPFSGSIISGFALAVFEYLEREGLDPEAILGASKVAAVRAQQAGERFSIDQWKQLLLEAGRILSSPEFLLRLVKTIRARHLGMMAFLPLSWDTLHDAAIAFQRYGRVLDNSHEVEFSANDDHCILTWHPLIEHPPAEFTMWFMALGVQFGRCVTARADLQCDADFALPASMSPIPEEAIRLAFGGRIRFDQSQNKLVFPASYLSLPVIHRTLAMPAAAREQAEADLALLEETPLSFIRRLEALIAERLERAQVSLDQIAQAMAVSPRTLQNRLEQQGQSYREVLDRVRCTQAERHLLNSALSISDVAELVGFSDQSSFQHAFKRWTGISPGEWRRRGNGDELSQ